MDGPSIVVSSPTWSLKKITAGIQVAKVQSFQLNSRMKGRDERACLNFERIGFEAIVAEWPVDLSWLPVEKSNPVCCCVQVTRGGQVEVSQSVSLAEMWHSYLL